MSRTITDSVDLVHAPPANLPALEERLTQLRNRYPGATLERYLEQVPEVAESAYLAPTSVLIGRVRIGDRASIWPGCVLRGDINAIEVGDRSNVQDGTVVHVGDADAARIGADVVIGHRAVIHGCRIGDAVLVGIQATVLDGADIGAGSVIGAGAVVTAGTVVPPRSLVLGIPGRIVKTLTEAEEEFHRKLAAKYMRLAHNFRHG